MVLRASASNFGVIAGGHPVAICAAYVQGASDLGSAGAVSDAPSLCGLHSRETALESSARCEAARSQVAYLSCGTLWPCSTLDLNLTIVQTTHDPAINAESLRNWSRAPAYAIPISCRSRTAPTPVPARRTLRGAMARSAHDGPSWRSPSTRGEEDRSMTVAKPCDGDLLRASATPGCATSSGGSPDPQPLPGSAYRSPPRFHTAGPSGTRRRRCASWMP